jgi:hypothetical protein
MVTTRDIEDALIGLLEASGVFEQVGSAVEAEVPEAKRYPSAFVYFGGDRDSTTGARPAPEMEWGVLVFGRNLRSPAEAARSMYAVLDAARDAVNGKRGGLADIEPFRVVSRAIMDYKGGVVVYEFTVHTGQQLPLITME